MLVKVRVSCTPETKPGHHGLRANRWISVPNVSCVTVASHRRWRGSSQREAVRWRLIKGYLRSLESVLVTVLLL